MVAKNQGVLGNVFSTHHHQQQQNIVLASRHLFAVRTGEQAGRARLDLETTRVVHKVAEVAAQQHSPFLAPVYTSEHTTPTPRHQGVPN